MSTDQRTVSNTRTEINVEEVEETMYLCRNCDQAYDEDEIMTVAVDVDDGGDYEAERQLCRACGDSVLDYSNPDTLQEYVNEMRRRYDIEEVTKSLLYTSMSLGVAIVLLTGVLGFMFGMAKSLGEAVAEPTSGEAASSLPQAMQGVFELMSVVMILIVVLSVVSAVLRGGRY